MEPSTIVLWVVFVIMIIGGIYYVYKSQQLRMSREAVFAVPPIVSTKEVKSSTLISNDQLPRIDGDYTISFWIYVEAYPTPNPSSEQASRLQTILYIGTIQTARLQPWVGFSNKIGRPLSVAFTLRDGSLHYQELETIPLRTWTHVAFCMERENNMTFYLNGKLHTSIQLTTPILRLDNRTMTIHDPTSPYEGAITRIVIQPDIRSSESIRQEYLRGPLPWRFTPDQWFRSLRRLLFGWLPTINISFSASATTTEDQIVIPSVSTSS